MPNPEYFRPELMGKDVTPQEQERLVRLMEECGEVIQACSKILRWGWYSTHPNGGPTNVDSLLRELHDVTDTSNLLLNDRFTRPNHLGKSKL